MVCDGWWCVDDVWFVVVFGGGKLFFLFFGELLVGFLCVFVCLCG